MEKQVWGNAVWLLFHTLAAKLKPEFADEPKVLFGHIKQICSNLPCPDCAEHATALLNSINVNAVCASSESLKSFLYYFHNNVNSKIKKPQFTQEEANARYAKANTQPVVIQFIQIMETNMNNEKMMMMSFHRKQYMKNFRSYVISNAYKYNP